MKKTIGVMTAIMMMVGICAFNCTVSLAEESYTMDFHELAGYTDSDGNVLRSVPELNWYGYDANSKTKNTFTLAADENADGGYYIKNNNSNSAKVQAGVYYPASAIEDCTVKTSVKFTTLSAGNAFYVIVRSGEARNGSNIDSKNYYALKGTYSGDGEKSADKLIRISIIKCENGEETELASAGEDIAIKTGTSAGLWYNAGLKAEGNTLSAYFGDNEEPVASAEDSSLTSGGAGVGASANNGRVWFDNLVITSDGDSGTPGEPEDIDYFINYDFNDPSINADENGCLTTDDKASYYFVKQGTKTEPDPEHYRAEYFDKSDNDKCIRLVDDENGIAVQGDQSRLVIPFNTQTTKMISEFDWKGKFINKSKVGHYFTSDGKIAAGLEMFRDAAHTDNKKVFVMRRSNAALGTPDDNTYTYSNIEIKDDQWYRIHTEVDLAEASANIKIYELSGTGSARLVGTISGPLAKTGEEFTEDPSDITSLVIDTQGTNSANALLREVFVDNFKLAGDTPVSDPAIIDVAESNYTLNGVPAEGGLSSGELKLSQALTNSGGESAEITCITVLYKDGVMNDINSESKTIGAKSREIYTTAISVPETEDYNGYTVKTFIWDSIDGMRAVKAAAEYPNAAHN